MENAARRSPAPDGQERTLTKIAIIVLGQQQWPQLEPHIQRVVETVNAAKPGSYTEVDIPFKSV